MLTRVAEGKHVKHMHAHIPLFFQDSGFPIDCGEQDIYAWGSIWPLYSPTTRIIYKNEACALCHNVNDGIKWTMVVNCDSKLWTYGTSLEILLNNFQDSGCKVYFMYKENSSEVMHQICYKDLISDCGTEVKDQPAINLTSVDIHDQCSHGAISTLYKYTTKRWYKNIFCAMCNGLDVNMCLSTDNKPRSFVGSFISILNPKQLSSLSTKLDSQGFEKRVGAEACRISNIVSSFPIQ